MHSPDDIVARGGVPIELVELRKARARREETRRRKPAKVECGCSKDWRVGEWESGRRDVKKDVLKQVNVTYLA